MWNSCPVLFIKLEVSTIPLKLHVTYFRFLACSNAAVNLWLPSIQYLKSISYRHRLENDIKMCGRKWSATIMALWWNFESRNVGNSLGFEVVAAVKMSLSVFCVVTPRGLVRFGGTYRFHLQGKASSAYYCVCAFICGRGGKMLLLHRMFY